MKNLEIAILAFIFAVVVWRNMRQRANNEKPKDNTLSLETHGTTTITIRIGQQPEPPQNMHERPNSVLTNVPYTRGSFTVIEGTKNERPN